MGQSFKSLKIKNMKNVAFFILFICFLGCSKEGTDFSTPQLIWQVPLGDNVASIKPILSDNSEDFPSNMTCENT